MKNPKDYAEKSVALFMRGYNCCQAVFAASVLVMERLLREFPAERA